MKVAICGTTPHRDKAPFEDLTWEIWGQNRWLKRWTRWFEIHPRKRMDQLFPQFMEELKTEPRGQRPVYMAQQHQDIPASVEYPFMEVLRDFPHDHNFFKSGPAWQMCLAIHLMKRMPGSHSIGLFGIDMAESGEYAEQRDSMLHWISEARKLGISVLMPEECLLRVPNRMYALGPDDDFEWNCDTLRNQISVELDLAETEREERNKLAYMKHGKLELLIEIKNRWRLGLSSHPGQVSFEFIAEELVGLNSRLAGVKKDSKEARYLSGCIDTCAAVLSRLKQT